MTHILDLNSGDEQSPLILLRQCRHIRRALMAQVQENFERISGDVLPHFVDGSRLFRRAAERTWNPEHIDFALQEVRNLEALCGKVELLLRCYQDILAAPSTSEAATSRTGLTCTSRPSDQG
jgi:hypothetical protein